jgi:hypothetical protein
MGAKTSYTQSQIWIAEVGRPSFRSRGDAYRGQIGGVLAVEEVAVPWYLRFAILPPKNFSDPGHLRT